MKKARIYLVDGTIKEMTVDELNSLDKEGMMKAMDGKAVVDIKFYDELDN